MLQCLEKCSSNKNLQLRQGGGLWGGGCRGGLGEGTFGGGVGLRGGEGWGSGA